MSGSITSSWIRASAACSAYDAVAEKAYQAQKKTITRKEAMWLRMTKADSGFLVLVHPNGAFDIGS